MRAPRPSSNARLLIVDDEETILFGLESYFVGAGFDVRCARALPEALALHDTEPFDLVIADIMLTASDEPEGIVLLERLRRGGRSPRVILLTAFGSETMEEAARERGADAFLRKPQPLAELERLVRNLLGAADPTQPSNLEAEP